MKTHDAELGKIKDLLRDNPKGMKITRVARTLAMNRNAAAKYLEILLMTGQVELLEHGMSKIFILSRSTGIPTMLDRSEDFILVLDGTMKICRVNSNFLKFTGCKQEELLGRRPDTTNLPVIGRQFVVEKMREAHYGTDIRTEVREVVGGQERFFDLRMTPTLFNDGTRGITIIIGDITRDKKKLASVADEGRLLVEGILSCIDDAVVLLDFRTGAVLFANPAALKMSGARSLEEYGGKCPGFVAGIATAIPGYPGTLQKAFLQEGYYETESRMRRTGSGEFPVTLHLRPIYARPEEIKNIVVIIRDLGCRSGISQAHPDAWSLENRPVPGIVSLGSGWAGISH